MSLVTSLLRFIILRATFWPLTWWVASLTLPKEPSPSVRTIVYWPRRWFALVSLLLLSCTAVPSAVGGAGAGSAAFVVLAPPAPRRWAGMEMESSSRSSLSIAADMAGVRGQVRGECGGAREGLEAWNVSRYADAGLVGKKHVKMGASVGRAHFRSVGQQRHWCRREERLDLRETT